MSDQTASADGAGNAGGAASQVLASGGEGATGFDWAGALGDQHEAYKPTIEAKGWKGPADALKGYTELEKRLGNSVSIPSENATIEERAAFNKRLGVPDAPDGYQFNKPEGIDYNDDMADWFRKTGHKLGIPAAALGGVHDAYYEEIVKPYEAEKAKQAEAAKQQLDADIAREWPEADREKNQDLAIRGGKLLGLDAEDFDKLGGMVGDFKLVEAMRKLGDLAGEDALLGGGAGGTGMNAQAELDAFKRDPEVQNALADRRHKDHKAVSARLNDLQDKAYGPMPSAR